MFMMNSIFLDDSLENIISYLCLSPHQPCWDTVKLTQVSKQFRKITTEFHPVLQIIEKVRNDHILFIEDSIEYTFPMNWTWKLEDMLCLFKSKMGPFFVKKYAEECVESQQQLTKSVLVKFPEEKPAKKAKKTIHIHQTYLSTIFNQSKRKILFDNFLNCLVNIEEIKQNIRNSEVRMTVDRLKGFVDEKIISLEMFENMCNEANEVYYTNELYTNEIQGLTDFLSLMVANAKVKDINEDDEIDEIEEELIEKTRQLDYQEWWNILKNNGIELHKALKYLTEESIILAKEINFQIPIDELFDSLQPKQKLQLFGCLEVFGNEIPAAPLAVTVLIKTYNDYPEWLEALGIDPKSKNTIDIPCCQYLRPYAITDLLIFYLITRGYFEDDNDLLKMALQQNVLIYIVNGQLSEEKLKELFNDEEFAKKVTNEFLSPLEGKTKIHLVFEEMGNNLKTYKEQIIRLRDQALRKHTNKNK